MPVNAPLKLVSIDLLMDLDAPKDSAPWARAMRQRMLGMLKDAKTGLWRFRDAARLFQEHRGYQQLDDQYGHPFPSFRTFCTAKTPHGLGYDPQVIDALAQETREMTLGEKMAEIQALQPHGTNRFTTDIDDYRVDVVNSTPVQGGNSRDYLLARLKRDSPGTAEALSRGEYPSVRAAAKAAGIVQDPTPLAIMLRGWAKASPEERAEFLRRIQEVSPCPP